MNQQNKIPYEQTRALELWPMFFNELDEERRKAFIRGWRESASQFQSQLSEKDREIKELRQLATHKENTLLKRENQIASLNDELIDARNRFEQEEQKSQRIYEAMQLSEPWNLLDVLNQLSVAANKLLYDYEYDGNYHEEIRIASIRSNEIVNSINEYIKSTHPGDSGTKQDKK